MVIKVLQMIFTDTEMNEIIQKDKYKTQRCNEEEFKHLDRTVGVNGGNKEVLTIWEHKNVFQEGKVFISVVCC